MGTNIGNRPKINITKLTSSDGIQILASFEPRRSLTGQILGLLCQLLELQHLHIQVREAHPGQGMLPDLELKNVTPAKKNLNYLDLLIWGREKSQ